MKQESGFYGTSGNDPTYPIYQSDKALSSVAGSTISKLTGFVSPSSRKAQKLREQSLIKCEATTTPAADCSRTCLFDLANDPCETTDLSRQLPAVRTFYMII